MELLHYEEIDFIAKQCGCYEVINWTLIDLSDKIVGYLGDHLCLTIEVQAKSTRLELKLFVKCMPRFDKWKAAYLEQLGFFKKEYIMLCELFKNFRDNADSRKWRPKLYFIKEDLFVFEDVVSCGYQMPNHLDTMKFDEIAATVKTLARFHAESYIFEEKRSRKLGTPYRIWDDYSDYLQEPSSGQDWRNAGMMAVIDFLKEYSRHKYKENFKEKVETFIPMLFQGAMSMMKPNFSNRNVVVHRDIWSNNIFLRVQDDNRYDALFVDFQTVLYSSPMLDLSSLLYFNTTRAFRQEYTNHVMDIYYETLSEELRSEDLDISSIFDKEKLIDLYEVSIMFGITQAALIVPITAMTSAKREEIYSNPETAKKVNVVTRSKEFIEFAREDKRYYQRVMELFDEIVDRYIYPN